ncbi:MAG: hypothetical protein MK108_07115 [Mariniblastus sp.]|nr:hypothetical protein [Mariniblastus sp.]
MTRFCICFLLLLVCSSTAEAQFRRFAKPRMQRSAPLKKTTEMFTSIMVEELTKSVMNGLAEQIRADFNQAALLASQALQAVDRSEFDISIDPTFHHWTQVRTVSPGKEEGGLLLLMPAAQLSLPEVAKLAPGSAQFVAAIGLAPSMLSETRPWGSQEDRLYTFPPRNDESLDLLSRASVMLLAIGKDRDGQLQLFGYGRTPEPIFQAEVSIVDSANQRKSETRSESKTGQTAGPSSLLETHESLQCEILRPFDKEYNPLDHFLKVNVAERGPLKLQLELWGKYRATF